VLDVRVVDVEEGETNLPLWGGKGGKVGRSGLSRERLRSIDKMDLPERLEIHLASELLIPKAHLPKSVINQLLRLASFQNPEFYKHQAMRLPTYKFPRVICCAVDYGAHLGLPRGCVQEVKTLFRELKIKLRILDERAAGVPVELTFCGTLREEQTVAVETMLEHDFGVLSATTAFGKTVVGAWLIAQRKVRTLVLVHRRQLMDQWIERLSMFLDVPAKSIGQIGGGKDRSGDSVDVAIIQSMMRKDDARERLQAYGYVIVDECHHISAFSFEQLIRQSPARYVTGLTATVARKDGHHPIILMQCGPVRYCVNARQQAKVRPFNHEVIVRPTSFYTVVEGDDNNRGQFHRLYKELLADDARNGLICEDVINAVKEGRSPVVLTERKEHALLLAERLEEAVKHVLVLRGGQSTKTRRAIREQIAEITSEEERVLVATGRYIGEGFDDARLDTLFLTLPVSWRGTIAQYVGRLHRLNDQKTEVRVYDYADLNVPMLSRMFDRRCKGYEAIGYTILLPASAVPGWPEEVPLPIEPEWKQDYAASVRRLIHDGVDAQLGNLFVWATQQREGGQGVERARSSTEAFLWRRLESLPDYAGRFVLNEKLPIPFYGQSFIEVDFLCRDLKVALEIDGEQHLCVEAYRRDRQKDMLLQEHGYYVLRFLAEDVGKRLDDVLDGIARCMAFRKRSI
jgi:superfamily II DNA or RNA helicase/very-short-patch-repair endonuclease